MIFFLQNKTQYAVSGTSAATSKMMDPIQALKLSNMRPGQYFDGRQLGILVAASIGLYIGITQH